MPITLSRRRRDTCSCPCGGGQATTTTTTTNPSALMLVGGFGAFLLFALSVEAAASFQVLHHHHHPARSSRTCLPLFPKSSSSLDKGFNVLELASGVVPQGKLVETAKEGWKFLWKRMMVELAPQDKDGSYSRPSYTFSAKSSSMLDLPDEAGRYHLYVGNPCPWCHRTSLARALRRVSKDELGLTRLVDDPVRASRGGWIFGPKDVDPLFGSRDLRALYERLSPGYQGRCTAPLLVDMLQQQIVSNESSEIVQLLNRWTFGGNATTTKQRLELRPLEFTETIDKTNEWIYRLLNNGVYRCGFSTSQEAYNRASADVRLGLQQCQDLLEKQPYICGNVLTECDVRLLPTMLRFDGAYSPLFRAGGPNIRLALDYPAVFDWMKRCWQFHPEIQDTIDIADATSSYFRQLFPLHPSGFIPTPPLTAARLGLENEQEEEEEEEGKKSGGGPF